jgi:hypothetical protein
MVEPSASGQHGGLIVPSEYGRCDNPAAADLADLAAAPHWHFDGRCRLFAHYLDLTEDPGTRARLKRLVRDAFRLRVEIVEEAARTLARHGLAPGSFVAAHIRRGDFQYHDIRGLSDREVAEAVHEQAVALKVVDAKQCDVLLCGDEDMTSLVATLERRNGSIRVVCWSKTPMEQTRHDPIVDMLCCAAAGAFLGTPLSTFSTGIEQWRGRMGVARDLDGHTGAARPEWRFSPPTAAWGRPLENTV